MSNEHQTADESVTPVGVVAIFIKDGRVIAHGADFNLTKYGGYTLKDSQQRRADAFLAREVVCAYCSHIVSNSLDSYDCEQLVSKLKGTTKYIYVGHGEE